MSLNKILFVFLLLIAPRLAFALDVEAIRFGVHSDKIRIVVETSQSSEFQATIIQNPARLILDLPQFVWQAGYVNVPPCAGIKSVRHTVHKPGISRIVFELNEIKGIKSAFTLPPGNNAYPRLVIDLVRGGDVKSVFGNLKTDIENIPPSQQAPYVPSSPAPSASKPLIVIDAGHGGNDPGAISPQRFHEKNIVLNLSRELKKQLESSGKYRVKLTRDNDTYIRLSDRVKLSRQWGADMFISLHADSIGDPSTRGASVYTLSNTASDKLSAKLAEQENKSDIIAGVDLSHEDKIVADILTDLVMRDTMNQSRFLANLLVDSFKNKKIRILPNTHRYAGFAVLKAPDVPSVLIEAGFLSNRSEASNLSDDAYRRTIMAAVKKGVDDYFAKTGG